MMSQMKKLEGVVSTWPTVSMHPHPFGGKEFRFGSAEVGHVHRGGIVDIPFPRSVRDALLPDDLAEQHRWVPNSGWTTFPVHSDDDLKHARWLMRLSYLRYALKTATGPLKVLAQEIEQPHLSPPFRSLLEPFANTAHHISDSPAVGIEGSVAPTCT